MNPEPIHVHIKSIEADLGLHLGTGAPATAAAAPAPAPRGFRTEFGQLTVDDVNPHAAVLPHDARRLVAQLQVSGGDVIICESEAMARQGTGAVLAHANTAPWALAGQQAVWVAQAASGTTCILSWTADIEA